jgi:cytochrome b
MNTPRTAVRVWDLPTRVFHWVLAASLVGSVVTAQIGGNAMVWHFRLGYLALGLLVFRLVWGFAGGRWSRFSSFVFGPAALLRYLRGRPQPGDRFEVGHSPLGALSVFALLGVLALQVGTGLFADDEIANVGPLNRYISGATAGMLTGWHKDWGAPLLLGLVVLHIAAILFYRLARGKDLIRPMLGGDKPLPADTPASEDGVRSRVVALGLALVTAALLGWAVVRLGG